MLCFKMGPNWFMLLMSAPISWFGNCVKMSVFVLWSNIIFVDYTEGLPSFASIDVSFISLNLILPALAKILVDGGQVVALVKPQFEAGREQIGKNGIVRESSVHEKVLETVTAFAVDYGFSVKGLDFSPIQGGHGNIEFLAHLEKTNSPQNDAQTSIKEVVAQAHKEFKKNEEE